MSQFDNIIFGKKKFSDILEEIYNNQQKKDKQVTALINELKCFIALKVLICLVMVSGKVN